MTKNSSVSQNVFSRIINKLSITQLKWTTRVLSAICLLACLVFVFFSAWFTVTGLRKSDYKEAKNNFESAVDSLLNQSKYESSSKTVSNVYSFYDLAESDMFEDRGDLKAYLKEAKSVSKVFFGFKYRFSSLFHIADWGIDTVERYDVFWDNSRSSDPLFGEISPADLSEITENLAFIKGTLIGLKGFFVLVLAIGLFAVVFILIGKRPELKYIFFVLVFLLSIASIVSVICLNMNMGEIASEIQSDIRNLEDLRIHITLAPILSIVFAGFPILLSVWFSKKVRKTEG